MSYDARFADINCCRTGPDLSAEVTPSSVSEGISGFHRHVPLVELLGECLEFGRGANGGM